MKGVMSLKNVQKNQGTVAHQLESRMNAMAFELTVAEQGPPQPFGIVVLENVHRLAALRE
jgi:hypothetical protein